MFSTQSNAPNTCKPSVARLEPFLKKTCVAVGSTPFQPASPVAAVEEDVAVLLGDNGDDDSESSFSEHAADQCGSSARL